MPRKNKKHDSEIRVLNLVDYTNKLSINADDVPVLISKKHLKEWQKNDKDPYYKVQEIDYPILANGLNYTESFFESFISKLKERPIPGSKAGHSIFWGERPNTDFVMIGGLVKSNGDKTGKVFFKNYIPPEGESGSNENFIRENKSDMVHYSLVTYPRYEVTEDEDGNEVLNAIESLKGERNDAVEYGLGAMQQKTNKADLNAEENQQEDKKPNKEKNLNEELLELLREQKANAINLSEIAEALGKTDELVTDDHREALKVFNKLKELNITDPVAYIKDLEAKREADAESVRNAELDTAFGSKSSKNLVREYAEEKTKGVYNEQLAEAIKELKEDPIALQLAKKQTDENNDLNLLGRAERRNAKDDDGLNAVGNKDSLKVVQL
jgi:hypothetical protein